MQWLLFFVKNIHLRKCYDSIDNISQYNFEQIEKTGNLFFLVKYGIYGLGKLEKIWVKIIDEYIEIAEPENHVNLFKAKLKKANIQANYLIHQESRYLIDLQEIDVQINEMYKEFSKPKKQNSITPHLIEKYGVINKKEISVKDYQELIKELIQCHK